VKLSIAALLLLAATAHADPSERCQAGLDFAKKNDLPRAALYLEGCSDDDSVRTKNKVLHQLDNSQLSALTVSTTPDGMVGEIDAYPGEQFTTPATVWVKAGTYKITVNGATVEKTIEPHSRTAVIINAPPPPKEPKTGVVSFEEEPEQHQGPPPQQKWGTMLPKKYLKSAPSGEHIDDPFARGSDAVLSWRLGARVGGGVFDRSNASAGFGFALAALAARPLDGPVMLTTRLDWSHRELDTIGANVGFGFIMLARPAFVLSTGAALRAEVRVQDKLDTMDVARAGIGAAADLDLAVLSLPIAFGLRAEQGFTELVPGARNRAFLVELGYDWR
jgi:hypothetical protein